MHRSHFNLSFALLHRSVMHRNRLNPSFVRSLPRSLMTAAETHRLLQDVGRYVTESLECQIEECLKTNDATLIAHTIREVKDRVRKVR